MMFSIPPAHVSVPWAAIKKAADAAGRPLWRPGWNLVPSYSKWAPRPETGFHVFGKGDTLMGIANRYGVSHRRLAQANPTVNPNSIRIGARINIPENEREYIIRTKGIDPERVNYFPPNFARAIRMRESLDGKQLTPKGMQSSAKGLYHMLRGRFLDTQALHPEMAGWKHEDLLTDNTKAQQAFDWAMQDAIRKWQYQNGTLMPVSMMLRSWHKPNDLNSREAIEYEKFIMQEMQKIVNEKRAQLPRYIQ